VAAKLEPSPTPRPIPTLAPPPTPSEKTTLAPFHVRDSLGCLQSSPEPFNEGGVYVFFCLKHAAKVSFKVFDAKGRQRYEGGGGFLPAGSHQVFFAGKDSSGKALPSGRYRYQLQADYGSDSAEWRQSEFNLKRKKR
jgi:hypothetical protein